MTGPQSGRGRAARKWGSAAAFVGCVIGANVALARWGIVPFLGISSLMVPAGVYFAGPSFAIRDVLHEIGGRSWVIGAIAVGAGVAFMVEDTRTFAVASAAAFGASETADALVYAPLRRRHRPLAAAASNIVGSTIDSVLFLWLAFGWEAVGGGWFDLTVAKFAMTLPVVAWFWWRR